LISPFIAPQTLWLYLRGPTSTGDEEGGGKGRRQNGKKGDERKDKKKETTKYSGHGANCQRNVTDLAGNELQAGYTAGLATEHA